MTQSAPAFTGGSVLPDGRGQFNLLVQTNTEHSFLISSNLRDWQTVFVFQSPTPGLSITSDVPLVELGPTMFFRAATGRVLNFGFHFQFDIQGGSFGAGLSPAVAYPVSLRDYQAVLDVEWETNPPALADVLFTGPPGSGLTNTPAGAVYGGDYGPFYASPMTSNPPAPPPGPWTVQYRGVNYTMSPPPAQAQDRLVVPVPTVTLSAGLLYSVAWTYRNKTTGAVVGAPAYLTDVQLQVDGDDGFGTFVRLYDSPELSPAVTSHVVGDLIEWNNVTSLILAYSDDLGNHYVIFYSKP